MSVELATAYVNIVASAKGMGKSITNEMNGVDRQAQDAGDRAGRSFGGRFASRVATIVAGMAAFRGISAGFQFAKGAVFDFNSQLQQADIGFSTMLGSGQKSKAFLDQLKGFAKSTPFEFEGLVQNSQTLLGMGIAAKDIIPTLTALGDSTASVGGNADKLNQTILAFAQTAAKGTLDMGNMNQLLQGGVPNALKILAAKYKVTTGEMVKMISAGKVQSSEALPLLVEGIEKGTKATAALGGMMDKQSHTMQGALGNIGDSLTQTLAKAGKPFFDGMSTGAQHLADYLGSDKFTGWTDRMSAKLTGLIKQAPDLWRKFTATPIVQSSLERLSKIWDTLKDTAIQLWPSVQSIFSSLAQATKSLGVSTWSIFLGIAQTLASALKSTLVPALKWLADFMKNNPTQVMILVGALTAYKVITTTITTFTKLWAGAQRLLNLAMKANPIGLVIAAVAALAAGFAYLWTHSEGFRKFWIGLWDKIKSVATSVANWFMSNVWPILNRVFSFIKDGVAAVLRVFKGIWEFVSGIFTGNWSKAWQGIKDIFGGIWDGIKNYAKLAIDWFGKVPGWIWDKIKAFSGWLFDRGAALLNWIWNGIKSAAGAVWGWFAGIGDRIWGGIKTAGAAIIGFGGRIIGWIGDGITGAVDSALSFFANLASWIWNKITGLFDLGVQIMQEVARGMASVISSNPIFGLLGGGGAGAAAAAVASGAGGQGGGFGGGGMFAKGTSALPDGYSIINELGPELLYKQGANVKVMTAGKTQQVMAGGRDAPLIGQVNITEPMDPWRLAGELDRRLVTAGWR